MKFLNSYLGKLMLVYAHCNFLHSRVLLVGAEFYISGLSRKQFVKTGDLNLGALMPMSYYVADKYMCSDSLNHPMNVHIPQVLEYAVSQVNQNGILPRNITLGFIVLDDCYIANQAVAQALAFLPQTTCSGPVTGDQNGVHAVKAYGVIGVIGSSRSSQSKAVAQLLSPAQIPLISFFSTSDELSDKTLYPYFLRTVPPDRFQFRAIFTLIKEQGWTYVSVVYEEGSYGENGFKQLRDLFDASGVCLAAVHKVSIVLSDEESDIIARDLIKKQNGRLVVLITSRDQAFKVIAATGRRHPRGTFIWVGSDAWADMVATMTELGELLWGSLVVGPVPSSVPDYDNYFEQLTPKKTTNPWFQDFWNNVFGCDYANNTCNPNANLTAQPTYDYAGQIVDTVNMFANATARVLMGPDCRGYAGTHIRDCVTGPLLLAELKLTRQPGYTGWVEVDSNGDRLGEYLVRQVMPASFTQKVAGVIYQEVPVARFDALSGSMTMVSNLSWDYHWLTVNLSTPESRCSWPCGRGEARVPQEVKCCWLCQPCRVNEHLTENGTRCGTCPLFTWPDLDTGGIACKSLPVDVQEWNSAKGVAQTALAFAAFVCCVAVLFFFVRHRQRRVIKASSCELSLLMFLAMCLGYVTMVTLLAAPNDVTCRVNYLLFCLSFTLLYGSLLVRTLRIYRIFSAGQKSKRMPCLVGSGHQVVLSLGFVFMQALMCGAVMAVYPTWHKLTMKVVTEPYVELSCDMHEVGLASFLVYNLLMVSVCAFLAFKTRRLPDNFNESRFISMCVSTTLVIWLASIPAYMVSGREHLKMLMLALALALNHSVALVFLFLPKVYAVLYLEGAGDVNTTFRSAEISKTPASGLHKEAGTTNLSATLPSRVVGRAMTGHTLSIYTVTQNGGPNFNQVSPLEIPT